MAISRRGKRLGGFDCPERFMLYKGGREREGKGGKKGKRHQGGKGEILGMKCPRIKGIVEEGYPRSAKGFYETELYEEGCTEAHDLGSRSYFRSKGIRKSQ